MIKIITPNKHYLLLTLLLFIIEICIAKFFHDKFIRPYFGDLLVVILIYCFVKSFWNIPYKKAAIGVLLFAFFIETLQYFHLVKRLGLQHNTLAKTIIGSSFNVFDLVMYSCGILIVVLVESICSK